MEPRDYTVVILYEYTPLKVSHHHTKFCGHEHCRSGDVFSLSRDLSKPGDHMTLTLWVKGNQGKSRSWQVLRP